MKRKLAGLFLIVALVAAAFTGCGKGGKLKTDVDQLDAPKKGEQIAVITVKDFGVIKARLFPSEAPKAVENFVGLAEKGYYDGLIFHRVAKDLVVQTGDPTATGAGGESLWGKGFGVEISKNLHHFNGAIGCAMSDAPDSIGSQFYITNCTEKVPAEMVGVLSDLMKQYMGLDVTYSKAAQKELVENGGAYSLDGRYTIFGQVYEGMDVVEKMMAQDVDESDRPLVDIVLESVRIEKAE